MDALSGVLRTIRLTGAAFFAPEPRAPWAIVAPSSRAIADALMPEADHVVADVTHCRSELGRLSPIAPPVAPAGARTRPIRILAIAGR